jgi:hypothetical protein
MMYCFPVFLRYEKILGFEEGLLEHTFVLCKGIRRHQDYDKVYRKDLSHRQMAIVLPPNIEKLNNRFSKSYPPHIL